VLFVSERSGADQDAITLNIDAVLEGQQYFLTMTELWDGGAGGASASAEPVITETAGSSASGSAVSLSLGSWATQRIEITYVGEGDDAVQGRGGDDTIEGFGGADVIRGGDGNDVIDGGTGEDALFGEAGDDVLLAGAGDDSLNGGSGTDTALFSGSAAAYSMIYDAAVAGGGAVAVTSATEGTDTLWDIEVLAFADGTLTAARVEAYIAQTFGGIAPGDPAAPVVNFGDVLAAPDYSAPAEVQMEIGTAHFAQPNRDTWHSVTFSEGIENAVVVMGPASAEGGQPLTVRVREVSDWGFEYQIAEWAHLDGWHEAVSVSWMAGSAGTHRFADGTTVSFGATQTTSLSVKTVELSGFGTAPTIFTQVGGDAEATPLTDRLVSSGVDQFEFLLQPEEALAQTMTEIEETMLYWSAFDFADGGLFDHRGVAHSNHRYSEFGAVLEADEALFAEMQSFRSTDTAVVRYLKDDGGNLSFRVQEEKSLDWERRLDGEDVAWFTLEHGVFDFV
jgi:Ca2+-binding RTX toxin-like protein